MKRGAFPRVARVARLARTQALFARSHPGRVDELLGCVVDGAALATWRLQDVEQAWIDRGLCGRWQLHLVCHGAMMIVQQELGIEHAVELPETPDEVRLSMREM